MIARKSLLIMLTQGSLVFLGFAGTLLLAQFWGDYGPTALGSVWFALSFVGLFWVFSDLGFGYAHIKKVSEGKDEARCVGTFTTIKLGLTALIVVLLIGTLTIGDHFFDLSIYDATTISAIYLILGYYVIINISRIATRTFQGRREIAKSQIAISTETVGRVPMIIIVALAGTTGALIPITYTWPGALEKVQLYIASHTAGALAFCWVLGGLCVLAVSLYFFRGTKISRPTRESIKEYAKFAIPLSIVAPINIVSVNIGKVLVGIYWTAEEVAFLGSAQQFAMMFSELIRAMGQLILPTVSALWVKKKIDEAKFVVGRAERYIFMIILPVTVFFMVEGTSVLGIFYGDQWAAGGGALFYLAIYSFFIAVNTPMLFLLSGANRPDLTARISVSMAVVLITLTVLLVPSNGLLSGYGISGPTGAGLAAAVAAVTGFTLNHILVRRALKLKISFGFMPRQLIAGAGMAITLYFVDDLIPIQHWYQLIAVGLIGFGTYLALLAAVGEFRKKDYRFFVDTVNPLRMLRYIRDELRGKITKEE